jgi:hypothetical protein
MVFGKVFSFVFGSIAGAYGMHQYIYSQAMHAQFPDWNKVGLDTRYALNRTAVALQRAINDEDTQEVIKKAKVKGS